MAENILIRGDTATLSLPIINKITGEAINIKDIETIFFFFFMIPKEYSKILIKKDKSDFRFEDNLYKVDLKAEDTESFDFNKDINSINFDIEVTLSNGVRKTGIYSIPFLKDYTIHGGDSNE